MSAGNARKNDPLFKRIRLLRKKLKQVENLKLLSRKLNTEEVAKVEKQDEFRCELLDLLAEQNEQSQQDNLLSDAAIPFSDEEDNNELPPSSREDSLSEEDNDSPKTSRTSSAASASSSQRDSITPDSASASSSSTQPSRSPKHKLVPAGGQGEPAPPHEPPLKRLRKTWANRHFEITELTGHTDIVRAVDINEEYIVSASRDTSVKLWSCLSGDFIQNFGGHTNQVNCVKLVKLPEGDDSKSVVVSGSEDCTVRFWDISSGKQLKEFYVYNTVTCLAAMTSSNCLIAGLDGGKLELFDLEKLSAPTSHSVDTTIVTSLSVEGNLLAVGGADGLVEVLEVSGMTLRRQFALEQQLTGSVKSISLNGGQIIVGDEEANMKNIHWKQNRVTAIANHLSEFGVTDALCSVGSCLLSSAHDYDAGKGFLNVRDKSLHKYDYISSISDPDILHILSVAATTATDTGLLTLVTGGIQLVLWKEDHCKTIDSVRCKPRKLVLADDQLSSESDDYSEESEVSESESTESEQPGDNWWCTIL